MGEGRGRRGWVEVSVCVDHNSPLECFALMEAPIMEDNPAIPRFAELSSELWRGRERSGAAT